MEMETMWVANAGALINHKRKNKVGRANHELLEGCMAMAGQNTGSFLLFLILSLPARGGGSPSLSQTLFVSSVCSLFQSVVTSLHLSPSLLCALFPKV